jgi:hypothetical protein
MTSVAVIRSLVANGNIQMRLVAGMRGGRPYSHAHALPVQSSTAICGFVPSGLWGDAAPPNTGRCSHCLKQLNRAGFGVSWANVIVADEASR